MNPFVVSAIAQIGAGFLQRNSLKKQLAAQTKMYNRISGELRSLLSPMINVGKEGLEGLSKNLAIQNSRLGKTSDTLASQYKWHQEELNRALMNKKAEISRHAKSGMRVEGRLDRLMLNAYRAMSDLGLKYADMQDDYMRRNEQSQFQVAQALGSTGLQASGYLANVLGSLGGQRMQSQADIGREMAGIFPSVISGLAGMYYQEQNYKKNILPMQKTLDDLLKKIDKQPEKQPDKQSHSGKPEDSKEPK